MYHSTLTYALRKTYLYKWLDLTFFPSCPMLLGWHTCTIDLISLGRNYLHHSFLNNSLRHTCTNNLTALDRNLMYHSILTLALRQTYLFEWFDHTLQELNVSFQADQLSRADILVLLIWSPLAGTYCIIPLWSTLLGTHICTGDLITLGKKLENHSIPPMNLGRQACTCDMITFGWHLIYNSILTNAVR
jgi:hypothetical protein